MQDAVLEIDEIAMKAISGQNLGNPTELKPLTISVENLNEAQRSAIGDRTVYEGLRITATSGGKSISEFEGGRMTISIPFTLPEGFDGRDFSAFHTAEDGSLYRHASGYADGAVTFRVAHFSDYIVLYDPHVPFTDIAADAWYTSSVHYVAREGLMVGVGGERFAPDTRLTRAMMVQILFNMEKDAKAEAEGRFTDVADDAWYAAAVNWAAENGIVQGMGDGIFNPNQEITREQLTQMLYNYAQFKHYDTTRSATLSRFADADQVSDWAKDALSWAVGEKLVNGFDTGDVKPGDGATRAQTAKVLTFFQESFTL